MEFEKEVKQLRGLIQNKNLSEEELLIKAKELKEKKEEKEKDLLDVDNLFQDKKEKVKGKKLLHKYVSNYSIETVSDKNILSQVIYTEILIERIQEKLNSFKDNDKAVPISLVDTLLKLQNQALSLKEKLGILDSKESNTFKEIEVLKRKLKNWGKENQASRTIACPSCGQMVLWRIRTDIWEAQRHPFFKDKVLGNKNLIELYFKRKLTKVDVAKVLGTPEDYTDWLIEKWKLNHE